MATHPRVIGSALGAVVGLTIGGIWWFTWGCQVCAPGGDPLAPILVSIVAGTLAGAMVAEAPPR